MAESGMAVPSEFYFFPNAFLIPPIPSIEYPCIAVFLQKCQESRKESVQSSVLMATQKIWVMVLVSYRDMLQDDVSSGCSMKQMLDCHWNRFDDMETLSGIC